MNFQKILMSVAGVVLVALAYQGYGWGGVAVVLGSIVMWLLLHFTRMMQVLKRTADRPIGYVDSAVMLNAKLKPRMTLLHVVAMTRSLGLLQSEKNAQPEIFRWTDTTESHVTCEFLNGKLVKWALVRPAPADETPVPPAA